MTKIHVLADETLGGIKREYVEVDRKAEVGEKVVHVNKDRDESDGIVTEVTSVGLGVVDVVEYASPIGENVVGISHGHYRVLVPVEAEADEPQPADLIDVVSNLATRVADLERTIKRQKDEIDTLHKDNRTLGEELARLKEGAENEACAPIDAPLVFVQRKIGDVFDVYQDGKRLRGIKRIRIDAAMEDFTTHEIEFVSGATEEERP